jgi:hypothetical protein
VTDARGIRRLVAPHFGTLFFVAHVGWALARGGRALGDPGTGWHLATGRLMLDTGAIPRQDVFSFTAEGRPWINYYWLFEWTSAWLVDVGGLPLYAVCCALVYALVPMLLYGRMLRGGANPLAALAVTPLAYVVLLSHAIARPHVVTYVFVILLLNVLDDVREKRRPTWALWWVPALTALWCNMHGGFAAGIAIVGVLAAAAGVRWVLVRERDDFRQAGVFGALAAAMAAATLLNPYGIALPIDVFHHLGLESTSYFVEFRSPDFAAGGASVAAFELLALLLLFVLALGPRRFAWAEIALLVVVLHWALVAQRNKHLFVLVAAPLLARALTPIVEAWAPRLAARWRQIGESQATLRSPWLYVPAVAALAIALALQGRTSFPATLDGLRLSRGAIAHIEADVESFARPFNTDSLGGPLIHRFWPRVRVFVDDRTFVYGEAFVLDDYFTVQYGRPGWQAVLDRWQITRAIVVPSTVSAAVLRASADWDVAYEDEQNVIFARGGAPP